LRLDWLVVDLWGGLRAGRALLIYLSTRSDGALENVAKLDFRALRSSISTTVMGVSKV
jgi:hypothetical protein